MPTTARKQSTYVDFRTVKAAVSFEAVLEHYNMLEDLDPKDDGYTGDCPFHEGESRRPFHVSLFAPVCRSPTAIAATTRPEMLRTRTSTSAAADRE